MISTIDKRRCTRNWNCMCMAVFALLAASCSAEREPQQPRSNAVEPWLVASDVGIDFVHDNGMQGQRTLVEILGPGGAALDADGDGDLDLVLRQGAPLGDIGKGKGDRLYLNQLKESGQLHFVDASAGSGLDQPAYGIGIATGDFDGDGLVDLYLANFGPDRLLRNRGDGTFEDVTGQSGVGSKEGITGAAAFVDIDGDGALDLAVAGYTDFSLQRHRSCRSAAGSLDYCGPLTYGPAPMRLLRNDGAGRFEDISRKFGVADARANALGLASADVNGDGRSDLFLASDALENQFWINHGDRLQDEAMERGVAVNGAGIRTGDMGVAFGDVDGDARFDLVSTHLASEFASLWLDHGDGYFEDRALALGLGAATGGGTGFGVGLIDLDLDGWLDLLIVNGEVRVMDAQERAGDTLPLKQRFFLLRNQQGQGFVDVADRGGDAFQQGMVGRGLVLADLDDDGDLDAVVLNNNGPALVLQGTQGDSGRWIGLDLRLPSGAPALGAIATLQSASGKRWRRHAHVDGSFASARDPRIVFGLGDDEGPFDVVIEWTDGSRSAASDLQRGRYHRMDSRHDSAD